MEKPLNEAQIQANVLLALTDRCADVCRVWRQNTGAVQMANGRMVRFGIPGAADLTGLMLVTGRRLEIECKTFAGRMSPEQERYGEMIRKFGGIYIVVRSAGDAIDQVMRIR